MVGTWLINSVSPKIQASIIYMDIPLEIWNDLKQRFSQGNGSRIFNLLKVKYPLLFLYSTQGFKGPITKF